MKSRASVSAFLIAALISLGPRAVADVNDLGKKAASVLPPGTSSREAVGRAGVFENFLARNAGAGALAETSVGYVPAIFILGIKNTTKPERLGSRYALAAAAATPDPVDGHPQGYPTGCAGTADSVAVPQAFLASQIGISNSPWRLRRVISSRGEFFDPTDPDGEGLLKGLLIQDDTNDSVVERGNCECLVDNLCNAPAQNPSCDAFATFLTPVFSKKNHEEPGLPGIMGRSWFVLEGKPWIGPPYGSPNTPPNANQEPALEDDANSHVTWEFLGVDADHDGKPDQLWVRQDERLWAGAWISDRRVSKEFADGELADLIHPMSTQSSGSVYEYANRQRIVGGTGLFRNATGDALTEGTFRTDGADFTQGTPMFNWLDTLVYVRIPCGNPGVVPTNCVGLAKDATFDYAKAKMEKGPGQLACNDGIDNDGDGKCDWDGCNGMPPDPECKTPWGNYESR